MQDDVLPLQTPIRDPKTGEEITHIRVMEGQVRVHEHNARSARQLTMATDDFHIIRRDESFEDDLGTRR